MSVHPANNLKLEKRDLIKYNAKESNNLCKSFSYYIKIVP